ncbi:Probable two-component-system connector protein AriR [Cedecea davisae]|uniref:Putative regulatory protein AriR n=1 Tax=Cedecea davisae DSM 4568 TaxID=566551 RepID=S3IWW5_9ENTR|nr:biofilm development regulator YmgB/AriR family protein [Cedecea davisae]EPF18228.1 putative regulatory protein AriR [Cedecea davisae DSM 4568]SUX28111.1 Probable two-component-system connector protein AriR [Cedecea davisae]
MTQLISNTSEMHTGLADKALTDYIRSAGDRHAEENAAISQAITAILSANKSVSNKAIIIWLVEALETTDDVVMCDVYRNALEIVVGHTMDDI